jgi:hypothetical protein
MITPPMVAGIHWGTYPFFAAWNAVFVPVVYVFYPETAGRSLEEIDIIFAKGYTENTSYVKAARELPRLTEDDIAAKAAEYGFGMGADSIEKGEEGIHTEL